MIKGVVINGVAVWRNMLSRNNLGVVIVGGRRQHSTLEVLWLSKVFCDHKPHIPETLNPSPN